MATSNGLPAPSEVKRTIVEPEDSLCVALVKIIRAYTYAYRYHKWKYDEDGEITDDFCSEVKSCIAKANTTP